jgi:hypothetical protein
MVHGGAKSMLAGRWTHAVLDPTIAPAAAWGVTATLSSADGSVLAFGGEHPLGIARARSSTLWTIDTAAGGANIRAVPRLARDHPAPRRQHAAAALPDGGLLVVGGIGDPDGLPLGDAWMLELTDGVQGGGNSSALGGGSSGSSGSRSIHSNFSRDSTSQHLRAAPAASPLPTRHAAWTRNRIAHAAAALLARSGHTLTPLPPPQGSQYLREAADAAFLLFGGRATPRVAALAHALPNRASSAAWRSATLAEYQDASLADAVEPDSSLVTLNDLLLLVRGRSGQWDLTRLKGSDTTACSSGLANALGPAAFAGPTSSPRPAAWQAGGGQPPPRGVRRGPPRAPPQSGGLASSALQPQSLSDDEVEVLRAERAPRSHAPCARHGHSAHLYAGRVGTLPGSWCSPDGGKVGCLLVFGGADAASTRLDDLWLLAVDPRWARPRDVVEATPPLSWRALLPAHTGAVPAPRAFHASVLAGGTLYVIGGEVQRALPQARPVAGPLRGGGGGAASGHFRPARGGAGDDSVLWTLDLPSLRWTAMYAAGDGAPRPGAGAAAVLASVRWSSVVAAANAADRADAADGAYDAEEGVGGAAPPAGPRTASASARAPAPARDSILLIGGAGSDHGESAMPMWLYPLGRPCVGPPPDSLQGCSRGEACDGATGECVCAATGAAPPCKPARGPPPPLLEVEDGAMRMIGHAWALVGMSVVGASVGGWAARQLARGASR